MRHHRSDVVETAIRVLDTYGLADLSMRRLAAELAVRPSALYHHFPSKQVLLAAVADEVLARGARARPAGPWDERAVAVCVELRDAMLAYRDGAELVTTVHAFRLGGMAPYHELTEIIGGGGFPPDLTRVAARALLHYVFGHVSDEQTQLQAGSAGAIEEEPPEESDFELGLTLVLDGIRLRRSVRS